MDSVDDFGRVYALKVGAGDPEVGVSELALDDRERYALTCHFDSVSVPELMRRKPPTNASLFGESSQLSTSTGL